MSKTKPAGKDSNSSELKNFTSSTSCSPSEEQRKKWDEAEISFNKAFLEYKIDHADKFSATLAKHGFFYRFEYQYNDGALTGITCILTHISGHSMEATAPAIGKAPDAVLLSMHALNCVMGFVSNDLKPVKLK